jgi:hypothetical protein
MLRGDVSPFQDVLSVFDMTGADEVLVVPDTNALLDAPDPVPYRGCVDQDSFTFVLIPTVLGELDRLKIEHRNPDVREKAQKAITRIKGWRLQGSLLNGVTVDKLITVKALAAELTCSTRSLGSTQAFLTIELSRAFFRFRLNDLAPALC